MKTLHKTLLLAALLVLNLILSSTALAQNIQQAGKTECGILYVDTDSAATVSKNGQYYLAVAAEEKYTDPDFLAEIRQDETMREAASALYLYLFNNTGTAYSVAAAYILDAQGKTILDLGADLSEKQIGKTDAALVKAYSLSLAALEKKKKQASGSRWIKK